MLALIWAFYFIVGQFLWAAQVLVVVALGAASLKGQRAQGGEWPELRRGWLASLKGRRAADLAARIAAVFTVLMAPVALMVAVRTRNGEQSLGFTHPIGIACVAQALLFLAAYANAARVRRAQ